MGKTSVSKPIAIALMSLVGVTLLGTVTVYASDDAKPGDLLYPADILAEQARLALTFTDEGKVEVEFENMEERVAELEEIKAENTEEGEDITEESYGSIKGLNIAIEQIAKQQQRLEEWYLELLAKYENGEISQERWEKIEKRYYDILEKKGERMDKLTDLDNTLEKKLEEQKEKVEELRREALEKKLEREEERRQEREEREQEGEDRKDGNDEGEDVEENETENEDDSASDDEKDGEDEVETEDEVEVEND
ncbi:hypothetical protein HYV12_03545 [Candidatus Dojkabacteria bacterium]|nr:hypothetical protein [Candidatus Dojkabacteria bacterium]